IIQSLAQANGRLYVMSNSGNRIDIFDGASLARVAQITDVTSPRYMVVKGSKGYVTNLYADAATFSGGKVTVIDLATHAKGAEIPVGDNPEGLALVGDRLYVANTGFGSGRTVNVIDTVTETVIDTIDVDCDGPRFLASDAEGEVFVFCTGRTIYDDEFNVIGETDGAVRILEGATGRIVERIAVEGRIGTAGPGQDAYHAVNANVILAIRDESTILLFDTSLNRQTGRIGPLGGDPIGAVAYDDVEGMIYLGRSAGFTAAGKVTIHLGDGSQVGEFAAGVVPAYLLLLD
ncbi:MAG: hypothetical protein WED81_05870, partial [Rhodothermales bacterium]